jgi:DHA2 family multidrug resistance protein
VTGVQTCALPIFTTYFWSQRTSIHHAQLTEHISASDPAMTQTLAQYGMGDVQRGAFVMDRIISQQALQIGFNEIFHALGWIFLGVILLVWIAKPPFAAKAGGAAAGGH